MPRIAYFSMEIGLAPELPTYSGGLGMLAGDTLRSAADLGLPMIGVTLLPRKGYFRQLLDDQGRQAEEPVAWRPEDHLQELSERVAVTLEGRTVRLRIWRRDVRGEGGSVPVLLLDSDVPENDPRDQELTHWLYGGDQRYRFCQEVILGIGGVRALRALGYAAIERFHMNEGHAALLAAELLLERMAALGHAHIERDDVDFVRRRCVFTTHTPVPAGHDKFPRDLVVSVVGVREAFEKSGLFTHDGQLNMTYAALNLSAYVNGVAKRHGEVSRALFPERRIDSITNGVHLATWACPEMQRVFDRHLPNWRRDSFMFRHAHSIDGEELAAAHARAKARLLDHVRAARDVSLDPGVLTLGFARRMTAYKRPTLLLADVERLRAVARHAGHFQVVFAGKAHPCDQQGKALIEQIHGVIRELRADVPMVFLPDYGFELCRLMVAGCDVWLNTPEPPREASGTSGMKAAANAVPQLSVLDGWWIEGCVEGLTGWSIGAPPGTEAGVAAEQESPPRFAADAAALYDALETKVIPLYRGDPWRWRSVMRHTLALNASYFNTQRMLQEYVTHAYFR